MEWLFHMLHRFFIILFSNLRNEKNLDMRIQKHRYHVSSRYLNLDNANREAQNKIQRLYSEFKKKKSKSKSQLQNFVKLVYRLTSE